MKKEITILPTWDWKMIYELDWSIEDYMIMKQKKIEAWWDWFYSEKYRTEIKFKSIQNPSWKTQYIALEAPKTPKKELTQEDRVKRDIMLAKILKDTAEGRKKRFFKYREEELKLLSIREQGHWLETTLSKLRRLKEYEEREIKEDFKNNK